MEQAKRAGYHSQAGLINAVLRSYLRETGWEDYLTTSGTGGGESSVTGRDGPLEPLPDFQQGVDGIDQAGDDFAHVIGLLHIVRDHAVEFFGRM